MTARAYFRACKLALPIAEEINKRYGPKDTPSDLDNEHHKRKPDVVPPLPDVQSAPSPTCPARPH